MKFKIRSSWVADEDVTRMFEYIRARSPQGAANWLRAFDSALDRLRREADSFSDAAESSRLSTPAKELLFRTRCGLIYRIVFRIVGSDVQILRVRGPGQPPIDPADLS